MHRCWLQPVQSRGGKHRQAEEDPLEGWWSERPAVYLVLHLHCLLLLKSTSVFAVPQCVLTFQVKKVPLASSAGVWAAVLCLTAQQGVGTSHSGCSARVCQPWSGGGVLVQLRFFLLAQCVLQLLLVKGADAYGAVGVAVLVESGVQGPAPSPA